MKNIPNEIWRDKKGNFTVLGKYPHRLSQNIISWINDYPKSHILLSLWNGSYEVRTANYRENFVPAENVTYCLIYPVF